MLRSEEKFVDRMLSAYAKLPKEAMGHTPRVWIRLLRRRLRMTQSQLAKRVGVPQSFIAKIETGSSCPTLETLEKIFRSLHCELVYVVIPEIHPDELLEQQARKAAQQKVKYVAGTMALEQQLPHKEALQEMIEEETNRLLHSKTSCIWDVT